VKNTCVWDEESCSENQRTGGVFEHIYDAISKQISKILERYVRITTFYGATYLRSWLFLGFIVLRCRAHGIFHQRAMEAKRESEGTVEEPLDLIKLSLDERMYPKYTSYPQMK
jgi:hypothetical protein